MIPFCFLKHSVRHLKTLNNTLVHHLIIIFVISACASVSILSTSGISSAADSTGFVFLNIDDAVEALQRRVEKASPGIVAITSYDVTGSESSRGSGFFIDRQGQILTNASVIKDAYSAEVSSESTLYNDVTVLSYNEDLDLALIRVKAVNEQPLDIDFEYEIRHNEKVDIIGKTHDSERTVSEGRVVSVNNVDKDLELIEIRINIPISALKTGRDGPLLNLDGKVIGIATAALPRNNDPIMRVDYDHKKINAVSMNSIKYFMLKPDTSHPLHPAKSVVWHKFILKKMKELAAAAFIFLYMLGFPKIIAIIFAIILLISLIQWIYVKQKKKWAGE